MPFMSTCSYVPPGHHRHTFGVGNCLLSNVMVSELCMQVRCYFGDNEQRWYMWYSGNHDAQKPIAAVVPSSGCTGKMAVGVNCCPPAIHMTSPHCIHTSLHACAMCLLHELQHCSVHTQMQTGFARAFRAPLQAHQTVSNCKQSMMCYSALESVQ